MVFRFVVYFWLELGLNKKFIPYQPFYLVGIMDFITLGCPVLLAYTPKLNLFGFLICNYKNCYFLKDFCQSKINSNLSMSNQLIDSAVFFYLLIIYSLK